MNSNPPQMTFKDTAKEILERLMWCTATHQGNTEKVSPKCITPSEALKALQELHQQELVEAKIKSRTKLLNRLTKTYNPKIAKPIDDSPMELTDEAKFYNRFVDDLNKFIKIEHNKIERLAELNNIKKGNL